MDSTVELQSNSSGKSVNPHCRQIKLIKVELVVVTNTSGPRIESACCLCVIRAKSMNCWKMKTLGSKLGTKAG